MGFSLTGNNDTLRWAHVFDTPKSIEYEQDCSKDLTLRMFQLCNSQDFFDERNFRKFLDGHSVFWVAGFIRLRRRPLKKITVVITDYAFVMNNGSSGCFHPHVLDAEDECDDLWLNKSKITTGEK